MPNGKPNILILWGDDIGWYNISHNNRGADGLPHAQYRPHCQGRDRIHRLLRPAKLHGRAGGLHHRPEPDPHRADQGGMPGADLGLQPEDPTIAELLKNHGYATGQFGKNHLGDPTMIPAHRPRLRRVLWQPLSPQCRGGAGETRLSQGPRIPGALWATRRAALQSQRCG